MFIVYRAVHNQTSQWRLLISKMGTDSSLGQKYLCVQSTAYRMHSRMSPLLVTDSCEYFFFNHSALHIQSHPHPWLQPSVVNQTTSESTFVGCTFQHVTFNQSSLPTCQLCQKLVFPFWVSEATIPIRNPAVLLATLSPFPNSAEFNSL